MLEQYDFKVVSFPIVTMRYQTYSSETNGKYVSLYVIAESMTDWKGKVRKHSLFSAYYYLYYVSFNQLTTKAQGRD